MTAIIINKEEYISSDILFEKAPLYCKVSRTGRDLIKKKKITDYIFAKLINNKWCVSDGKSYKFDKIFLKKSFYDTIPEVNQDKVIVDDNNIPLAPDIIYLDDSEKFKDENGVCVEIETRGSRKVDSIYFKVKDVSISFKLDNLLTTIIDKRKGGYIENEDYKYFNCEKKCNEKTKIKKELFLTFYGLLRLFINRHDPKTKECNVVNIIKNNYNDINWICDKPLKCKYRPDMYSIINDNVLLIEIDEHQHKHYDANIDKIRTKSIYNEFKNKNITIIRFNPDSYKDSEDISHNTITDDDNEMSIRMSILIDTINETINNTQSGIKEIKLFFDNFKLNSNNISTYHYNKNIKDKKFPSDMLKNIYNIIFTSMLGTPEQKTKYVSDILECSAEDVKEVFNTDRNTLPCVYFFTLGFVKDLRTSMKIDNKHLDDSVVAKYGLTKDLSKKTDKFMTKYNKIENVNLKCKYYSYIDPQYISKAETDIKDFMSIFNTKFNFNKEDELVIIPKEQIKLVERQYDFIGKSYMGHVSELITKIKDSDHQLEILKNNHQIEISKVTHQLEMLKKDLEIMKLKMQLLEKK